MRKLLLLAVLISGFVSGGLVQAQWPRIPQITQDYIYAAHFEGNNFYAGSDSLIFISTDRGESWHSGAIAEGVSVSITSIIKVNDKVFAGTYGNGVFQSTDNGISWRQFNEGLSSYAKYVTSFFRSGDSLFIGTDGGGIFFLNLRNALAWQDFNNGLPDKIAGTITALTRSGNNLIAGAGASGFYYLRPLNSDAWTERRIDTLRIPNVLSLASVKDTVFAGTPYGIFRSADNGLSWDSVGIRALPLRPTHFAADKRRIYAGFNREIDFFIWYSDDMGQSWESLDHQFANLFNLYVHEGRIWAATDHGLQYFIIEPSDVHEVKNDFDFYLGQNYPNPFNPSTVISFSLKELSHIKLTVYDILGREIAVLADRQMNKGTHNINFNASSLPAGIYLYQLSAGSCRDVKKMTVLK